MKDGAESPAAKPAKKPLRRPPLKRALQPPPASEASRRDALTDDELELWAAGDYRGAWE